MKHLLFLLTLLLSCMGASAKSWRIGPASVVGMDFATINAAMSSANVTKGDTLFLDQYYYETNNQTVNKQVTIIGTGYDTSLSDEGVVSYVYGTLILKADKIVVKSLRVGNVHLYNNDCIIDRCCAASIRGMQNSGTNHIYSSYIYGSIQSDVSSSPAQVDLQNCVVSNSGNCLYYLDNSIIKNNVLINSLSTSYSSSYYYVCYQVTNSEISNNIILQTNSSNNNYVFDATTGNAIEHNILSCTSLSGFPTNKFGYGNAMSTLFECDGSFSDYYRLTTNSAARGYANDGGDCGCHGGMFGCPSGGRPQYIPYFSKVVVGSRAEDGKLPVSITVKIQEQ